MRSIRTTSVIAVTLALLLSLLAPLGAAVSMSGAIFKADVNPGDRLEHKIKVSLSKDEPPTNLSAGIFGFGQNLAGMSVDIPPEEDNSSLSARSFLTVTPERFHLEPGQTQEILLTGRVPLRAGDGTKYAIVYIRTDPQGEGQVGVSLAFDVLVALTIEGTNLVQTGNIIELDLVEVEEGKAAQIIFLNQGNTHFRPVVDVWLYNETGVQLANSTIETFNAVIPNASRLYILPLTPEELSPGIYLLNVSISLDDGTLLDEDARGFSIDEDGNVSGTVELSEFNFSSHVKVTGEVAEVTLSGTSNETGILNVTSGAIGNETTAVIGDGTAAPIGNVTAAAIGNETDATLAGETPIAAASGVEPVTAEGA